MMFIQSSLVDNKISHKSSSDKVEKNTFNFDARKINLIKKLSIL